MVAVLLSEDGARWSHAGRFEGVAVRDGSEGSVARVLEAAARLLAVPAEADPASPAVPAR